MVNKKISPSAHFEAFSGRFRRASEKFFRPLSAIFHVLQDQRKPPGRRRARAGFLNLSTDYLAGAGVQDPLARRPRSAPVSQFMSCAEAKDGSSIMASRFPG